ncbi:MAG: DNRLRE domain-containing protein [Bacteroidetes bacterium]|nr:DNRLRE domain-containing protein [Bacteroidota bacterium]
MRIVTAFAVMLLFLTACQNDPDPTGIGLVPDADLIEALRFDSQRDSSALRHAVYPFTMTHASSSVLSVGFADGDSSRALLRWIYLPDSSWDGGRIVSASIRLRSASYHIGDVNASYRIEAQEITSFWNSFTFTTDSLPTLQRQAVPAGVFEGTLGVSDSIDIPLDSTLVRKWLVNSHEGKYSENYGVLLVAPNGGIRSFFSLDAGTGLAPELTVVIESNGKLDTLRGDSGDDTFIASGPMHEDAQRIVLQGGTSVRGKLFFDLSAIPPASVVNYATLYLTMDPALSTKNYHGADSVLVYESVDSTENLLSSTGVITRIDNAMPGILIAEGSPVTRAVQNWVNGRGNRGFILVAMNENTDLDRIALYGADADADKRPRLVVTYTSQP